MRFEDTHAVVTGGASGIGAATARRLAEEGALVTVADIDEGRAKDVAQLIEGGAVGMDVTDPAAVRAGMDLAARERGPIDVLVCCAGGDRAALFADTCEEDWNLVLGLNLQSVLACTHAVLPSMQGRRRGAIVNVASEAGRVGIVGGALYSAAKAGVIGFTKVIAREGAPHGVRCNAVAPGPVDTPMLAGLAESGRFGQRLRQGMIDATLFGRPAAPEEVAATIAFLASDDASFVTGHTVPVSAGISMW